jgi:hypothetical protein
MRYVIISIVIFFICSTYVSAQEHGEKITYIPSKGIYTVRYWSEMDSTFYTIPLFPGDECKPEIAVHVSSLSKSVLAYRFVVGNGKEAKGGLYTITIPVPGSITDIGVPNNKWWGRFVNSQKAIKWSNTGADTLGIQPGRKEHGFIFTSIGLPGIITIYANTYIGYGNMPDEGPTGKIRIKADSILMAHQNVKIKSVGPIPFPSPFISHKFIALLNNYISYSCTNKWIDNKGLCQSLRAKLKNVHKRLGKGNTKAAVTSLQAFINEVEAQKGKHLTGEGYGLLYYNGKYLLEQLEKQ